MQFVSMGEETQIQYVASYYNIITAKVTNHTNTAKLIEDEDPLDVWCTTNPCFDYRNYCTKQLSCPLRYLKPLRMIKITLFIHTVHIATGLWEANY